WRWSSLAGSSRFAARPTPRWRRLRVNTSGQPLRSSAMEVRVVDHPLAAARLTWSDTLSKSARPAKDFESCETVSIAESAQCCLVRCPAQRLSRRKSNEGGSSLAYHADSSRRSRTKTERSEGGSRRVVPEHSETHCRFSITTAGVI